MGDETFFTYNAVSNNCQDFLLAFLQSNNLGNNENYTFVKQDTESPWIKTPNRYLNAYQYYRKSQNLQQIWEQPLEIKQMIYRDFLLEGVCRCNIRTFL